MYMYIISACVLCTFIVCTFWAAASVGIRALLSTFLSLQPTAHSVGWSQGRQLPGADLHSSDEPSESSQ